MEHLPKGLWPVMLTPFDERNKIDLAGLERLTVFYIAAGANGLFANCLSSEMFQLTDEERITITRTVVKKADDKVPVVATGTFSKVPKHNIDLIKKLHDLGVQAVVINSNQLVAPWEAEDTFQERIEQLMDATGNIPLGIYECPVPYKRLISSKLMKWLGETNRFFYHKDTSCNLEKIQEKIRVTQYSPMSIFNANTPTAMASLLAGADGLSPVAANYYPELYVHLMNLMDQQKGESEYLGNLLTMLDSFSDGTYYPLSAKLFLQKRGLNILPVTRRNLPALQLQDYMKLDAMMNVINDQSKNLGVKLVNL